MLDFHSQGQPLSVMLIEDNVSYQDLQTFTEREINTTIPKCTKGWKCDLSEALSLIRSHAQS